MKNEKRQLKSKNYHGYGFWIWKVNFKFCIVIFTFSFFIFNFSVADAALLYLNPDHGDYGPGDTFIVEIRVDNAGECINASEVRLKFPTGLLYGRDFSKGESIFNLWVGEPEIDNEKGIVSFAGGIPAGYCGRIEGDPALSNILGKIIFDVPADVRNNPDVKDAAIEILASSKVLLNDGFGTSADTVLRNAKFAIYPVSPSPTNEWLDELKEDTIPPEEFKVKLQRNVNVYDGRYYVIFSTIDKQSGLDYFEVFEGGKWKRTQSPYILTDQSLHVVKVRAFDKAGNERLGEYIFEELPPLPSDGKLGYWITFIMMIVLAGVGWYLGHRKKLIEIKRTANE